MRSLSLSFVWELASLFVQPHDDNGISKLSRRPRVTYRDIIKRFCGKEGIGRIGPGWGPEINWVSVGWEGQDGDFTGG